MRALPILLLACLVLALPARPAMAAAPVTSVPAMDLSRYAGNWYEIAHLPVSFQRKCVADITASYALRADGTISVRNACLARDGSQAVAEGVARTVEGHPGRLEVRFVPGWLSWVPLVWADYWVIALAIPAPVSPMKIGSYRHRVFGARAVPPSATMRACISKPWATAPTWS